MKYTDSHEWVLTVNQTSTVGITDYAQKELGEVVYVELPKVGHTVKAGDEIAVLESTKAAVDIYTPLSGTIIAINTDLKAHPEYVNHASEGSGWLFQIELTYPNELNGLMSKENYQNYISK